MRAPRSVRLLFLVIIELARKYTRSLVLGFLAGLLLSSLFWKIYPFFARTLVRNTERIGMVGDFSPSTLPLTIQQKISTGLTVLAPDGSPKPALAKSWEATNSGKTFVFTLNDSVTWHNGKAVTAHDVNYNIRGVTLIPTGDRTLIAYLQYPYSPFPTLVSKPIVLPGLNGTGPYAVGNIQLSGGSVKTIQLYPVQEKGLPPLQYNFYQTETQATLAFKLGDVDTLTELSTPSSLMKWGKVNVIETTKYDRIVTLFFNMKNQLFQDKSVRQALAFGIPDVPYEKAGSPISRTSWTFTKNVKNYSFSPAEAKRLFRETQLGTISAELTLSTFPTYVVLAQKIASSWTSLGIPTKVKVESTVPQDYDVLLSAQDVPPDPDQYPFWHSTQTSTNVTGYANVKIDKLLEDGRQELDLDKRKTIYADFQRRLVEDAPAVFLYYPKQYTVTRGKK